MFNASHLFVAAIGEHNVDGLTLRGQSEMGHAATQIDDYLLQGNISPRRNDIIILGGFNAGVEQSLSIFASVLNVQMDRATTVDILPTSEDASLSTGLNYIHSTVKSCMEETIIVILPKMHAGHYLAHFIKEERVQNVYVPIVELLSGEVHLLNLGNKQQQVFRLPDTKQ